MIPRILLVSDQPENLPVWDHVMRQSGLIARLEAPESKKLKQWAADGFNVAVVDAGGAARGRIRLGRSIREQSASPILLCLPVFNEKSILEAYAAGMQDVLIHPLNPAILMAKIMAWVPHGWNGRAEQTAEVNTGKYSLNKNLRCFIDPKGNQIGLTSLEFRLLQLLMTRPGHIFRVEEIVRAIWGGYGPNDHVLLKNVVYRLRRKIGGDARRPGLVHTWPGGYSFQE